MPMAPKARPNRAQRRAALARRSGHPRNGFAQRRAASPHRAERRNNGHMKIMALIDRVAS